MKPDGALNEALRQVGLADVILINKTDLVTKEQLVEIRERIRLELREQCNKCTCTYTYAFALHMVACWCIHVHEYMYISFGCTCACIY